MFNDSAVELLNEFDIEVGPIVGGVLGSMLAVMDIEIALPVQTIQ